MDGGPALDEDSRKPRGWFRKHPRSRLDTPRRIVLRDFLIFEIKLLLDGFKGAVISVLAVPAIALDLIHPGARPGHRFYGVMRLGDRLDRWLSLYGIADAAEADPDGMFGVSRAGSPTLLGRLEAWVDHAVVGKDADRPAKPTPPDASGEPAPPTGSAEGARTAPENAAEQAAPADSERDSRQERVRRVAGKASEVFERGLSVLDRAVGVLEGPNPAASDVHPPPSPVAGAPDADSPAAPEDRRAAGSPS